MNVKFTKGSIKRHKMQIMTPQYFKIQNIGRDIVK